MRFTRTTYWGTSGRAYPLLEAHKGGEAAELLCIAWSPRNGYGYRAGAADWNQVTFLGSYAAHLVGGRVAVVSLEQNYAYGYSQATGQWERYPIGFVMEGMEVSRNLGVLWGTSHVAIYDPEPSPSPPSPTVEHLSVDGEAVLRWSGIPGSRYRVDRSDDLLGEWVTVSGVITALTEMTEWREPVASNVMQRFYRVEVIR